MPCCFSYLPIWRRRACRLRLRAAPTRPRPGYENEKNRSLPVVRMYNIVRGLARMVPFMSVGRGYLSLLAGAAWLCFVAPSLRAQENLTVGETPQQANDRIRTLSMGLHGATHDYVIGEGDVVEVSVFDVPELSKDLRVSETGSINLPLVPVRLHVAGLTETQAEEKVAEVLEANGLVTHAEVTVAVKEHRSQPITVVGAVVRPMVYRADHQVTLLEVLAEAGGIANDAGDTVIVTRQKTTAFTEIPNPQPTPPSAPASAAPGS